VRRDAIALALASDRDDEQEDAREAQARHARDHEHAGQDPATDQVTISGSRIACPWSVRSTPSMRTTTSTS
jgi:hypothetical protein